MKKFVAVITVMGWFSTSDAQEFTFKHERDVPVTKLCTISMADLEVEATLSSKFEAPKPYSRVEEIKKNLDKQRERKIRQTLHKYKESPEERQPEVEASFIGLNAVPGIPNDNNVAINNNGDIISVVNSSVSILNESGDYIRYYSLERIVDGQLSNLNRTYDPKVAYDPDNDRFILVFLQGSTSNDTRIITGFSQTSDPIGMWNFYAIEGNPFGGQTWSDYPIIGLSEDDLFVTVNILRDNESWQKGFTQSVIWQVDKASGYNGNDTLYEDVWFDLKYNDEPIWSICAVQGGSSFSSPNMYFLSVRPEVESNDSLFLHEITDTRLSGNATYNLRVLQANKKYGVPPSAFQPDSRNLLQTNDTRVLSAMVEGDYIQYVQSTIVPDNGHSGVFHGFINLATDEVDANYIYSDTFDYAYPSIAYAGNSSFPQASVIAFSHSSELHFPGTSVALHNRVEGNEAFYSTVSQVVQGTMSIDRLSDSMERWGDYTGIQTKYNEEGVVWVSGSVGIPFAQGAPRGRNGVQVGKVKVNNTITAVTSDEMILLAPNPSFGELNFLINNPEDQNLTIKVYDMTGKVVREIYEGSLNAGQYELKLNAGSLAIGAYLVSAVSDQGEKLGSFKFVVGQ